MENNLEALNDTLFETLKSLKNGSIDEKRANAVVNISNTIIKNTSVQLSAFKMLNGQIKAPKTITHKAVFKTIGSKNLYDQKHEYAKTLGYDNYSDAIDNIGKQNFENDFKKAFKVA